MAHNHIGKHRTTKEKKKLVELRLRVPVELKSTLQELAEAKNVPLTALGIHLINQLLNRKPDLILFLKRSVNSIEVERLATPAYREMLASYFLLKNETLDSPGFLQKCDRFKRSTDEFLNIVREEQEKRSKERVEI